MAGFDTREVEAGIADTQFVGSLLHLAAVESTNTLAVAAGQAGARTGVWVADMQTAGRGRGGHSWHSIAGDGLYVSVLVSPALPLTKALWISLATGLAAKDAIAATTGLNIDIRWPNDLMVRERKCGGILVETAIAPASAAAADATLRYAVIGIGINLNHQSFPEEISHLATSLRLETGEMVRREPLLILLLRSLERELQRLTDDEGNDLLARFTAASSWAAGKRVHVEEAGGYSGTTAGLDSRGFLQVLGDDGIRRTVLSGGVRETI
ncbi:biotin--[acetyl-CoA-carboxylase] ligase [Edaphobacter sp. HDX4]|uniref:biotin--[acetyl-CoA-carboxylase] ligase n=1 Tax=Edaphobacter sp. HDX4 TaxID=2794064 RepID=UPI002FE69D6A